MRALVDADVIAYQCGFASDNTEYHVGEYSFQYKKEATEFCKKNLIDLELIKKTVTAEPIEYCLSSVKKKLISIKETIDADELELKLTGKGNFRFDLYPEYKANRDPSHKPIWYKEIKEYLIDVWDATEVIGVEADDALGWAQWKDYTATAGDQLDAETCICTIDKDLNMIPGWHYNWNRDTMYWVSLEEANRFFFTQMLTGDRADNIPGIPRVGDKTAEKLLRDIDSDPNTLVQEVHYIWDYKKASIEQMEISAELLWIQRNPMEGWKKHYGWEYE